MRLYLDDGLRVKRTVEQIEGDIITRPGLVLAVWPDLNPRSKLTMCPDEEKRKTEAGVGQF